MNKLGLDFYKLWLQQNDDSSNFNTLKTHVSNSNRAIVMSVYDFALNVLFCVLPLFIPFMTCAIVSNSFPVSF